MSTATHLSRLTATLMLVVAAALPVHAAKNTAGETASGAESWDGLVQVRPKRFDAAYVAPGADFRPYRKLMVEPTQVAFRKDWLKNMNDTRSGMRRVTAEDAKEILEAARTNFADVFADQFRKAGYEVVTTPGPDVLRVSPGIINLYVNAPDTMEPGRSRTFTANAGEATLALELRDSVSNALLARVLDRRETRESVGLQRATSVSNVADFRVLFRSWAGVCLKALKAVKEASPIPETLTPGQKL